MFFFVFAALNLFRNFLSFRCLFFWFFFSLLDSESSIATPHIFNKTWTIQVSSNSLWMFILSQTSELVLTIRHYFVAENGRRYWLCVNSICIIFYSLWIRATAPLLSIAPCHRTISIWPDRGTYFSANICSIRANNKSQPDSSVLAEDRRRRRCGWSMGDTQKTGWKQINILQESFAQDTFFNFMSGRSDNAEVQKIRAQSPDNNRCKIKHKVVQIMFSTSNNIASSLWIRVCADWRLTTLVWKARARRSQYQ